MDARDQRVGRQDEVLAGDEAHQRRVVAEPEARGPRDGGEIAGDEAGFVKAGGHGEARVLTGAPGWARPRLVSSYGARCRKAHKNGRERIGIASLPPFSHPDISGRERADPSSTLPLRCLLEAADDFGPAAR